MKNNELDLKLFVMQSMCGSFALIMVLISIIHGRLAYSTNLIAKFQITFIIFNFNCSELVYLIAFFNSFFNVRLISLTLSSRFVFRILPGIFRVASANDHEAIFIRLGSRLYGYHCPATVGINTRRADSTVPLLLIFVLLEEVFCLLLRHRLLSFQWRWVLHQDVVLLDQRRTWLAWLLVSYRRLRNLALGRHHGDVPRSLVLAIPFIFEIFFEMDTLD